MVSRVVVGSVSLMAALALASGASAAEGTVSVDTTVETSGAPTPGRGMNGTISLLGNLGYGYSAGTGFGVSGRYQHTIVPDGVIKSSSLSDDFGIEGAVDYYHYSWDIGFAEWSYNEVVLSASVVWNLWFSKEFAAYPRLGIGYGFGSFSDNTGFSAPGGYGGLAFVGGVGVLYELEPITLRAELTNGSLGLGVAISL
jgi:hypothetical protein